MEQFPKETVVESSGPKVLETAEEIQERRQEVLTRYQSFKERVAEENHPDLPLIQSKQNEVNAAWERLRGLALQRQKALSNAADLQRFKRDVTEAIQWIKEKEPVLTSEDYGKDLVASEGLFHSH
ncbi:SPTA1 isoform 10, partial [Pan troglodytes]